MLMVCFSYEFIVAGLIKPYSSVIVSVGMIVGVFIASLFIVFVLYFKLFRRKLSGE